MCGRESYNFFYQTYPAPSTKSKLLTDYENLQKVVPNLVVNEVLQLFAGTNDPEPIPSIQSELSDAEQCREIANRMKGAVLRQVGGAKVVGINFSARTTLEVREWPKVSLREEKVFCHNILVS